MRDGMDERREGYLGPLDRPDLDAVPDADQETEAPSLFEEIGSAFGDGKTYLQAELAFQKSRAAYAGSEAKGAAINAVAALALLHLALIALVVGVLLALGPVLGPWGAAGLVVVVLSAGALVFALRLKAHGAALAKAFSEERA